MDLLAIVLGIVFAVALILFFLRVFKLYKFFKIGKPFNFHFKNPLKRLWAMLFETFSQSCSRSHKNYFDGFTHFVFFWGFIALLPSIANLILGPLIGFSWHFLGTTLYDALFFVEDVLIVLIIFCLILAYYRRYVIRPKKIENSFSAFLILFFVTILMISLIGHNAFELIVSKISAPYMPVSSIFATYFASFHLSYAVQNDWLYFFFWLHVLTILSFLVFIPYSKHLHLLAAFPNIYLKREKPRGEIDNVDLEHSKKIGASDVRDFTWKDYLDGLACTECGRCTDYCPANQTGKALNPKKIISKVKYNLYHNAPLILAGTAGIVPVLGGTDPKNKMMVTPEELWACTTCGSCLEQCPVYNEHVSKIVDMRRYLVMAEGSMPKELEYTYKNIDRYGNPWGFNAIKRQAIPKAKNVKTLKEAPAEYLLYLGCVGAYDSRYRSVTNAFIDILNRANISFGTLGNEETCCGDIARRSGNEDMFQKLAKKNIETMKKYNVKKIITLCPHGYNTIKNEYPQFDGNFEVYHYTEILDTLISQGKIKLEKSDGVKSTYHDPCYLGRYNNIYNAPRNVVSAMSKIEEMKKNRENSFCCGGGSGKFLMEEEGERINVERTKQALNLNVNQIITACPICMIMFEGGLTDLGRRDVKIKDVAELVAQNMK